MRTGPTPHERSGHEALADLTGQLLRLGLYASREDAVRFVIVLAVHWPTRADDAVSDRRNRTRPRSAPSKNVANEALSTVPLGR